MYSKTSVHFIILLSILLLSINICIASVQLDENFLKSNAGNSSVWTPVDELIETIKVVKLNDGKHPKIIGWTRKGNIYTFAFVAGKKIVLKFEHLVNRGGQWSSISATEDGKAINALALIMQIISMPRDKTRFDTANEQKAKAAQEKREIELALERKTEMDQMYAVYGDNREGDFQSLPSSRTLTISPLSNETVYIEYTSKYGETLVCSTGKKIAKIEMDVVMKGNHRITYKEDDCDIKFKIAKMISDISYYNLGDIEYRGTCQKYCKDPIIEERYYLQFLYPSSYVFRNIAGDIKLGEIQEKKKKDQW